MIATEDAMENAARENVEILRNRYANLTADPMEFRDFAVHNLKFVELLTFMRRVVRQMLSSAGGAPAKRMAYSCDNMLSLAADPIRFLNEIRDKLPSAGFAPELQSFLSTHINAALAEADSYSGEMKKIRDWAAKSFPITASPEEVNQRVKRTDENQGWIKLKEIVSTKK